MQSAGTDEEIRLMFGRIIAQWRASECIDPRKQARIEMAQLLQLASVNNVFRLPDARLPTCISKSRTSEQVSRVI